MEIGKRNQEPLDLLEAEPQVLDHLISSQTEVLQAALAHHWQMRQKGAASGFGPIWIHGQPDLGRRLITRLLCAELGLDRWELVFGSQLAKETDLTEPALLVANGMLLVWAEGRPLNLLCQKLLDELFVKKELRVTACSSEKVRLADMTVVVVTDTSTMAECLTDHFKLILAMDKYCPEQVRGIIDQRCRWVDWQIDGKGIDHLIHLAHGFPGAAIRILQMAKLAAEKDKRNQITASHISQGCQWLWRKRRANAQGRS